MEDITIGLISAGLSSSALGDGRSLDGDRADILAKILTGERERVLSSCSDDDDVAVMLSAFVEVEVAVSISSKSKVLPLRLLRRAACPATFVTESDSAGCRTCCIMRGDDELVFGV